MIKRRAFFSLIGGAAVWPLAVATAEPVGVARVGVLTGNLETDQAAQTRVLAFRLGLAELGWNENDNLQLDIRWPGPTIASQQHEARELVALAPAVILATSTPTTRALLDASQTIPIVFVGLSDPVATGIVSSLAHPTANVTGLTLYEDSLSGKWLALLKDMVPHLTHVGLLFNPDTSPYAPFYLRSAQDMGERVAIKVTAASVRHVSEIGPAMERLAEFGTGGLVVLPDGGFIAANIALTIELAAKYRMPAIYSVRSYAASGGLMSYGADLTDQFREGATYVDRILRGSDPRDLPVQFATKFDLVINLKTAAALGLTVPNHLLVDAELIE